MTSGRPPRIVATRHESHRDGVVIERVVLDHPPVAIVPEIDSVIGCWWYRAGGYPIGRDFGTSCGALPAAHAQS